MCCTFLAMARAMTMCKGRNMRKIPKMPTRRMKKRTGIFSGLVGASDFSALTEDLADEIMST